MNIREFAYKLQKLHEEISVTFSHYQFQTGLHCLPDCGRCCFNSEIESTPLEMIPMALAIYEEGKLEKWIESLKETKTSHCLALIPGEKEGQGKCGYYNQRPSLCRMFGVAGYYNKNKEIVLSVCKEIKNNFSENSIPKRPSEEDTPVMAKWTLKLTSLDPAIIHERLPINQALLKALEKVGLWISYEEDSINKCRTMASPPRM